MSIPHDRTTTEDEDRILDETDEVEYLFRFSCENEAVVAQSKSESTTPRLPVEQCVPLIGFDAKAIYVEDQQSWYVRVSRGRLKDSNRASQVSGEHLRRMPDGRVTKPPASVAIALLPDELQWWPLDDLIECEAPVACWSGQLPDSERVSLRLSRRTADSTLRGLPSGLLVNVEILSQWIDLAPREDFDSFRWVYRPATGQALIVGKRLPICNGLYLRDDCRVMVPFEMRWTPEIAPDEIRKCFGCREEDWLLWLPEGKPHVIPEANFQTIRRAAVRIATRSGSELATDEGSDE